MFICLYWLLPLSIQWLPNQNRDIQNKLFIYEFQPDLDNTEPTSVNQALSQDKWKRAMHDKLHALQRNETWTLIPKIEHMNIIRNKWVFKLKCNLDGSMHK